MQKAVLILVITAVLGCNNNSNNEETVINKQIKELDTSWLSLLPPSDSLKVGDIITRLGNDYISEAMRSFSNKDKNYSHVGILGIDEDSNWVVYHAIGTASNPDGLLRKDKLALFCNPVENIQFGVFRYTDTAINFNKVLEFAKQKQADKIAFDYDFNFETDNELYCSEFIYKAFNFANPELDLIKLDVNEGKKYLPLDNVYSNVNTKLVYKASFKTEKNK